MKRFGLFSWLSIAVAMVAAPLGLARAQAPYPGQSIRFIVPYAPGGLPDTVARIAGPRLGDRIGQPVVIENRPGGNGALAATALTGAPADGVESVTAGPERYEQEIAAETERVARVVASAGIKIE